MILKYKKKPVYFLDRFPVTITIASGSDNGIATLAKYQWFAVNEKKIISAFSSNKHFVVRLFSFK